MEDSNQRETLSGLLNAVTVDFDYINDLQRFLFDALLTTSKALEDMRVKWKREADEVASLTKQLENSQRTVCELEQKEHIIRKIVDTEKSTAKKAIKDKEKLMAQLSALKEILNEESYLSVINEETRTKLSLLKVDQIPEHDPNRLDTITEMDTSDDFMSDLSFTRDSEDDFFKNGSDVEGRPSKRHSREFANENAQPAKRRRSSNAKTTKTIQVGNAERVITKTTVTVNGNGPVSAVSTVKTVPFKYDKPDGDCPQIIINPNSDSDTSIDAISTPSYKSNLTPFGINNINTRQHRLAGKTMIKGETCNVCNKKMKFSQTGYKCKVCKTVCHNACRDNVPLPCIPATNTPTRCNRLLTIADFAPKKAPMVPALVVHCIKEIELRGMKELGLYRIPGSDKEVKTLKEKFCKGKGIPNLSLVPDVHTICGCLKEFLKTLNEPLTTIIRWEELAQVASEENNGERKAKLREFVSELPQPNRDTLAYIILHLQKVAESPECKMPLDNLSKVFGPTIIGYSSQANGDQMYGETIVSHKVLKELIMLPADFYETFMKETVETESEADMQKTPSLNSVRNFFQASGNRFKSAKKIRYFETP